MCRLPVFLPSILPVLSLLGAAQPPAPLSHSELTLSSNNAGTMHGLSLQSRWAHGGVTQSGSGVFRHLHTVHACLISKELL